MSSVRQVQKDASTKKMIDAARKEFARKGYSKTRTADIAISAGVSNGLPIQRFGSKEEIYLAVLIDSVKKYQNLGAAILTFDDFSNILVTKVENMVRDEADDFLFFFNFFNNPDIPAVCTEKMKDIFEKSILYTVYENAIADGDIISGNPWTVFMVHAKSIFGIVKSYFDAGMGSPSKEAISRIINISSDKDNMMVDISTSFASDYDFVFIADFNTDSVVVYKMLGKHSAWFMKSAKKGYDYFRKSFSKQYLYDDDKEWYLDETSKKNIIDRLTDEKSFYINHKLAHADGTVSYYQTKFVKYITGKDSSFKVIIGGHEINEVVREREKDKRTKNEMSSVIESLSNDYEGVSYVKLAKIKTDDVAIVFRNNTPFGSAVPGFEEERNVHNWFEMLKTIVHPEDRDHFYAATRREYLIDRLMNNGVLFVDFRVIIDGKTINYTMKFVGEFNNREIVGYTIGYKNADKEIVYKKEADKFKEIAEVLSQKYTSIYYCDVETGEYDVYYQNHNVVDNDNEKYIDNLVKDHRDYMDALKRYVSELVHPEDKESLLKLFISLPERMKAQKNVNAIFRRDYFGTYLYTEMSCVRVSDDANEPLRVVMGFAEMDAKYRNQMEESKQLELAVIERTKELQERNETLNRINDDIVDLLGSITEARDSNSGEHVKRVKGYTRILAEQVMIDWPEYGLSKDQVEFISSASALHDIGKIMIPDSILLKPGKLTPEEFDIMKTHCEKGCDVLKLAPIDWSATYLKISMDICRYHHEKYDGRGYPNKLKGDMIPISAQITSIADCFDALSTKRVYKDAYTPEESFDMVLRGECGAISEKMAASLKKCKDKFFQVARSNELKFRSSIPTGVSDNFLSGTKLLLADDSELGREIERDILEGEGISVVTAENGIEAIKIFEQSEVGEFDAILMDVMMPELDGLGATAIIRKLERADATSVPIIALTSLTGEADVHKCADVGMNSFLTKPVSVSALTRALAECMQNGKPIINEMLRRKKEEDMRILEMAIDESPVLGAYVDDYDFICYIKGSTNEIPSYKAKPYIENIINTISTHFPSNRRLDQLFKKLVPKQEFGKFIADTNRYAIEAQLKEKTLFQFFFRSEISGEGTFFRLVIVPDINYPDCYVLGFRNTDTVTYNEVRSRELIEKLAGIYVSVLVVDLTNNTYVKYSQKNAPEREYDNIANYTEFLTEYVKKDVRADFKESLFEFLSIDNIKEKLSNQSRIRYRYVDTRMGNERYYEIELINIDMGEKNDYVLSTTLDITETVVKEMREKGILEETQRKLSIAEKKANRDALTGVKNITAYTDMIADLTQKMRSEKNIEFGIVMCDINNLKITNDTYGHTMGDLYIKNCCNIICGIYKNSPVYRIGGDEFVVLLMDEDYINREILLAELDDTVETARKIYDISNGKASFAAGMAVYGNGEDKSVADVVKKADMNMYYKKNTMEK